MRASLDHMISPQFDGVALMSVKCDDKNHNTDITKYVHGVVTSGDWELEWLCDMIQSAIKYAHTPYKVVNLNNIFLVWLSSKNN